MNDISALILKPSELAPGDVLIYRPRHPNFIQKKISKETESPYTHAAIYMGNSTVAESVAWPCLIGVRKIALETSMKGSKCVAVLRSQLGFNEDRAKTLNEFVDSVLEGKRFYNLIATRNLRKEINKDYFDAQLEFISENYGIASSQENFSKRSFFCSSFVVACFTVVGIIGESAQVAFPPEHFSPAGIYRHVDFGWLLGYLLTNDGSINDIQEDDPIFIETTHWKNCQ